MTTHAKHHHWLVGMLVLSQCATTRAESPSQLQPRDVAAIPASGGNPTILVEFEIVQENRNGRIPYVGTVLFDIIWQCAPNGPVAESGRRTRGGTYSLPWPERCDQPSIAFEVQPRANYIQVRAEACSAQELRRSRPHIRCLLVANPVVDSVRP